jgi:ABC-2 type transport system ATP-binding protein
VKRQVGVVPEDLALFERLTAFETLAFIGQVYGLDRRVVQQRSRELLELMDLTDAADTVVADYSHGMRKKLSLAAAMLPAPRLLFLDEPFEGIDAIASRQIKDLLLQFVASGATIFVTSHILEIVERLCDQIGVIHKGRMVAQGPIGELRKDVGRGATLEEVFIDLVGASDAQKPVLEWLVRER